MRNRILALALAAGFLFQAGCASSFRAGGPQRGVEAEAAIGPAPVLYPAP